LQPKPDVPRYFRRQGLIVRVVGLLLGGLLLQGVVPLQGAGATASLLHVAGANVFFACSLVHAYQMRAMLAETRPPPPLATARRRFRLGWLVKAACAASALVPFLPAALLHPGERRLDATGAVPLAEELAVERAGFSQWWMVCSLIAYYTSYALDLAQLAREAPDGAEVGRAFAETADKAAGAPVGGASGGAGAAPAELRRRGGAAVPELAPTPEKG
jgi:hypothetical protein